jgi:allophanate hydrolase
LVRDSDSGQAIEVEVWLLATQSVGRLLAQIPHPLGLGSVELEDGTWVKGFICEPIATKGAEEITHLTSWRNYIN